ncbi:hypothetical protein BUALT_Bualt14G0079100 [Buddleja alternifolia]|uniref:Uncharacterized protein n=1 Tax=Buddleja alternifolia TaxID=168488 RepID=A0AAV6WR74_9LAMI|nr:hypothetical protein BUALT_Bualt14G0079100 [Buddleja alternifolia]
MRILGQPSGPGGPGPDWNGSRPRFGLVHGFFYNVRTSITSCFYVFCCCWLIEDCFVGRRSFPRPLFGSPDPAPPPHSHIGPERHGLLGSVFSPSEPSPPAPPHVGPGLLGSIFGPPGQPGPVGYPGEPSPFFDYAVYDIANVNCFTG